MRISDWSSDVCSSDLSLQPGKYYSVVVRGKTGAEKLATVLDPALTSKAKSLIILYNLTSKPTITLKTADGKAAVVADVAPGKLGSRSVNEENGRANV